jgi:hypothetical protein
MMMMNIETTTTTTLWQMYHRYVGWQIKATIYGG